MMMRQVVAFLLLISLVSCMKGSSVNDSALPYRLIETDTIRTGEYWGLNIGKPAGEIYDTLQDLRAIKGIAYTGIVGNVFTDLTTIQTRIPLYNALLLDETAGTSTGIQLNFEEGKIKTIYTNTGSPLSKWPGISDFENALSIGDSVKHIYAKLQAIKGLAVYNAKLQRLSLFDKNLSTPYDDVMSTRSQWQIVTHAINKRWTLVQLNFLDGKLSSVYSSVYENY